MALSNKPSFAAQVLPNRPGSIYIERGAVNHIGAIARQEQGSSSNIHGIAHFTVVGNGTGDCLIGTWLFEGCLRHVGVNIARANAINANIETSPLECHAAGQLQNCRRLRIESPGVKHIASLSIWPGDAGGAISAGATAGSSEKSKASGQTAAMFECRRREFCCRSASCE